MAKFNFMGKSLDELKAMSLNDFVKLIPARQRRTIKRGQVKNNPKLFKKIEQAIKELGSGEQKIMIKTHLRSLVITPQMVGLTIHVHSGNSFNKVVIQDRMIGHFIGEYVLTRKMVKHSSPGVGASRSSKFIPVK